MKRLIIIPLLIVIAFAVMAKTCKKIPSGGIELSTKETQTTPTVQRLTVE